jgi:hypothetical protein
MYKFVKYSLLVNFILMFLLVSKSSGLDAGSHMAVSRNTMAIWQDFDPSFYQALMSTPSTPYERWSQKMLYKFYYIGTTLPDLFWEDAQETVAGLLEECYNNRSYFRQPQVGVASLHTALTTFNLSDD